MRDVLRLQEDCYVEIEPESWASLEAKILASPGTCMVAEAADGVAGYLISVPIRYPDLPALNDPAFRQAPDADTLYIHDLAVAEAGRGTGAGRAMVRSAMKAAKAHGLGRACLVAIQGSVPYWERLGFEVIGAPPDRVAAKLASYGAAAQLMHASF